LIGGREPLENGLKLKTSLKDTLDLSGVKFGVSRYAEVRLRSVGAAEQIPDDRTNLHLGVDLYADADSPIYSPCEGVVFAYSPVIIGGNRQSAVILRHSTPYEGQFYTLFRGHFDGDDTILEVGRILEKGERFGVFRLPPDDDQHVPYLHFQVITDLLDLGFQFPGYCAYDQVEIWKHFSLDPNLILGIPAACFPPATNDKAQTRAMRRELIGPSLSISYREPVKVVRGWMQYLYDETGRRYVDAYNNVPHVGHSHPRVVQAAVEQIGVLNTNTRYLHDNLVRYAEALTKTVPEPLSMCFFVNSGSEANELAMRLSRAYTGAKDLIVLEAAYHGHTTSLVDISPYKHDGPGGEGPPSWVHTAPIPDIYRGAYKGDDPAAGDKYSSHVGEIIKQVEARDGSLAGYIAETYPSVGGQIIPPEGYFAAVYDLVRAAGGVCIADEVQTGYGRTGEHFYAFEGQDVVPDILVLGKPIGNGHPLGAVITTPEIAAAFDNGMEFFSTFGGNTVSCAVGLSVLEVVLDERLQSHAHRVGGFLLEKLGTLARRYPIVGDVRGAGLFLGVELVRDRETLQPATEEAAFICNRMRDLGVLLGTDGPYHNVLKIRPPMPFDFDDADRLVVALELVLEQDFQKF
jgi:4-aminobutyrate aminotransferase-like enzyme